MAGDDAGNNLVEETDARGHKTTYTVDGDTSRNEEVTDRLGNKTAYEYDDSGRTTKVISKKADGTELSHVSYAYDTFDNMTEIVRGDGMKYTLAYNEFHNLESIGIEGKSEALIKYAYKNGNGRLKQMTYANGHTMKAIYNSIGQMVAEKWFESEAAAASSTATPVAHYKYVYDGDGNIVRSIDISGKKEYNYEYEEGRIVRATESDITLNGEVVTSKVIVNTVKYYYDTEGKMTKKVITPATGSAQTIYYETNDDNTTVKFYAGGRYVTSHSKTDSFGRKVFDELQLGTDFVSRQFVYHAGKVTTEHKDKAKVKSSATTQLVSQIILSNGTTLSYGYDAEERITSVIETYTVDDTPVTNTTLYTYDALGQLKTETKDDVTKKFEYDNYGNITAKGVVDENGGIAPATKISYVYGNDTWKDLLTSYNGQSITYDAQGNPLTYLGHTLEWEKGRQLKKFDNIEYTYNANGIRTSKKVNGVLHTYTLDGTKILRETWDGNTLVPLYDNEDGVCGILYNNVPYYFIKNLQGDVIAIVDKDAQTVARYSYDAWGVCTVTQDSVGIATINPFRYRGYYYDEEIGLYYLQSRYYDASVGRFINADDISCISQSRSVLGFNILTYCENNPITFADTSGNLMKFSFKYAQSTIFSIKEFFNESKRVKKNFEKKYSFFNVDVVQINNFSTFEKKWNAMSAQDVVVINCHASPTSMNKGGMGITRLSQITNLNFKTIKCLILLGCNAGHYDYIWSNVAYEFSKRISGCVMASDGTVYSRIGPKFKSKADKTWKDYKNKKKSSRKKNWGWVIYRNYTWYSTNLDTISIPSAVDYLKKCNMVSFPNPLYEYYIPSFPVPDYYYL